MERGRGMLKVDGQGCDEMKLREFVLGGDV